MSQKENASFRHPRESELESEFEPSFQEYEEWRVSQMKGESVSAEPEKKEAKRKGFGKMDVLFIILGIIGALIYQSCKAGG